MSIAAYVSGLNLTESELRSLVNNQSIQFEDGESDSQDFLAILLMYVVPLVFGLVTILGLVGNVLVIVVVLKYQQMRNTTNLLILNLAFSDLVFILVCVPWTAVAYVVKVWPFSDAWCPIVNYMVYVSALGSVYTLVLMSADRYLAVVHAVRSVPLRNERNTLIVIAIIWLAILAANIPFLLQHGIYRREHLTRCINQWEMEERQVGSIGLDQFNALLFFLLGYLAPFCVICILYGLILRRLYLGSGMLRTSSRSAASAKQHRRVTNMIVIIVALFGLCWLPYHIVNLISDFSSGSQSYHIAIVTSQIFSQCLGYMNSCLNPIVYAFLSDNFRASFRRLVLCGRFRPVNLRLQLEKTNVPMETCKTYTS